MLSSINLEWIKTFVTFAESESLEEAAYKLNISQPAVTQHLSKLQNGLPKALFEKNGKHKVLTVYGKQFYEKASLHLNHINDLLRHALYSDEKEKFVELRFQIFKEVFYRICSSIKFDGCLDIFLQDTYNPVSDLLKRKVDVTVSLDVPNSSDIIAVKWFTDHFKLALPKSWIKNSKSANMVETVKSKNLLIYKDVEDKMKVLTHSMGLDYNQLHISHKLPDWFSYIRLIEDEKGWGFVPSSFELPDSIYSAEINNRSPIKNQFYLLYHKSVRNYPGFPKFLQSVLTSMKNTD